MKPTRAYGQHLAEFAEQVGREADTAGMYGLDGLAELLTDTWTSLRGWAQAIAEETER